MRWTSRWLAAALIGIVAVMGGALGTAGAQHAHTPPGGEVGTVRFATSCAPAVQADLERALAMLHSFWFSASTSGFNAVLEKDPGCAMAHWGVAMNLLGNVTILERPVRVSTMLSTIRAALRGRRRQYELRDQLEEIARARDALKEADSFFHRVEAACEAIYEEQRRSRRSFGEGTPPRAWSELRIRRPDLVHDNLSVSSQEEIDASERWPRLVDHALEQLEVVHRRVQRRHETFRRVELALGPFPLPLFVFEEVRRRPSELAGEELERAHRGPDLPLLERADVGPGEVRRGELGLAEAGVDSSLAQALAESLERVGDGRRRALAGAGSGRHGAGG